MLCYTCPRPVCCGTCRSALGLAGVMVAAGEQSVSGAMQWLDGSIRAIYAGYNMTALHAQYLQVYGLQPSAPAPASGVGGVA